MVQNYSELYLAVSPPTPKKGGIKEATLGFGRWNQMSSSNILSIHGLKKKHQFQDSNRDIQWWLCTCDNHVRSVLYY
jgi:hypothetical protein